MVGRRPSALASRIWDRRRVKAAGDRRPRRRASCSAAVSSLTNSGGYRIRVEQPNVISPWVLFAALNAPIVKRQIRAKQFTQDIIDTLGKRLWEVILPIPRDLAVRAKVAKETQQVVETRATLRNRAKQIAIEIEGGRGGT